jgi:two-component system OmpR family response regulator
LSKHVLIVDDEARIREVLQYALTREGFRVSVAGDGQSALDLAARDAPDLVVLDVMLPEIDGLEVCRALRRRSAMPVLFLSARSEEVDRIVGLEIGGDDYLTKPFSPRELVARVRAVLRRWGDAEAAAEARLKLRERSEPAEGGGGAVASASRGGKAPLLRERSEPAEGGGGAVASASRGGKAPLNEDPAKALTAKFQRRSALEHGPIHIDFDRHEVRCAGQRVELTPSELTVLAALLERPGVVLPRSALVDRGHADGTVITERTIDSHVRRIRKKFESHGLDPIATVHGVGYKASGA